MTKATTNPQNTIKAKTPTEQHKKKIYLATIPIIYLQILLKKIHFIITAINYIAFKTITSFKLPLKH